MRIDITRQRHSILYA